LKRIIFLQAFVIELPNPGNNVIMLLKDTSLAFTMGIVDIMGITMA
jgi:L-cystine transport system permease protein